MQPVSIVGCGYTGLRLAARCRAAGMTVRGFATSARSLGLIAAAGADAENLNLDVGADSKSALSPIDVGGQVTYYLVPPAKAAGDPRLQRFLSALVGSPRRVVYVSTTGVYGDQAGAQVNEDTPPAPITERAARRLAAETLLRAWAEPRAFSWCILRVPGIYGPDRLPLERLRRGDPAIVAHECTPGNRIHVDDLVSACMAAGTAAAADRRVYNVTDGTEDSLTEYLLRVARIACLPAPPLISRADAERSMTASSWSFLAESRRVDSRRMREELGVAPLYRDLDAGIRASLTRP